VHYEMALTLLKKFFLSKAREVSFCYHGSNLIKLNLQIS
jgi:hypothetical protein